MELKIPQLSKILSEVPEGANLLSVLTAAKVPVAHSCGGDGVCGTCRLHIEGPALWELSEEEMRLEKRQKLPLKRGERFACLVKVGDVKSDANPEPAPTSAQQSSKKVGPSH